MNRAYLDSRWEGNGKSNIDSLSDEELFRYLDGQLSEVDAAKVQARLNRDPEAFRLYTTLLRLKATEPSPEELADFEKEHVFTPPAVIVKRLNLPRPKSGFAEIAGLWAGALLTVFQRVPRVAYGLAAVLVAAILVKEIINPIDNVRAEKYLYDAMLPLKQIPEGLRSGVDAEDLEIQKFLDGFGTGLSNYVLFDYAEAIQSFQKIQGSIEEIAREQPASETQKFKWLRNYYLYRGLSHLALSTSKKQNLSTEDRKQHLNAAITDLEEGVRLVRASGLDDLDREYYFLALAQALAGMSDEARKTIAYIPEDREYYEEAQALSADFNL